MRKEKEKREKKRERVIRNRIGAESFFSTLP
jgi:hypothetical protein